MSILDEAHNAVHVSRRQDYDHPSTSFTRLAGIWTAMLKHLLKDEAELTPEIANLMLIAFKVSREIAKPKRDNRIDIAGYAETLEMQYEDNN